MDKNNFKDHFSGHAEEYSRYRPDYPEELFKFLSSIAPGHSLAWDCATGSGQAARGVAKYFHNVIATDASEQQIKNAVHHKRISYNIAPAHKTSIQKRSIDLITIAQALHWFEFNRFYKEAERVLKQNGIVAAWTYNLLTISPDVDPIINHFYHHIIGEFWPPERKFVESGYKNIPFPFRKLPSPKFRMSAKWTIEQLIGYMSTWSAVKRYRKDKGSDPMESIEKELAKLWHFSSDVVDVNWPLSMLIGKKTAA